MALQGMGVSTFWGFTPAIDLQNAPPAARSAGKWKAADGGGGGAPLRVLVAGCGTGDNMLGIGLQLAVLAGPVRDAGTQKRRPLPQRLAL